MQPTEETLREKSARGGYMAAARMTPEARKARGLQGHLNGSVNTVIRRAADLSPEQRAALVEAFGRD